MLNAKRGWPVGQGSLRVLSSILNGIHSHGLWKGPSSMSFQKELEGSFIQGENDWVVAGLQSSADDKGKAKWPPGATLGSKEKRNTEGPPPNKADNDKNRDTG